MVSGLVVDDFFFLWTDRVEPSGINCHSGNLAARHLSLKRTFLGKEVRRGLISMLYSTERPADPEDVHS